MLDAFMTVVKWVLNSVLLKASVFGILFALVAALGNYLLQKLGGFTSTSALTSAFASIPAEMWYFIDMLNLAFGLPLVISAFVARFLIRRIPVIG